MMFQYFFRHSTVSTLNKTCTRSFMVKTSACILSLFLFLSSSAQNFLGVRNGVGEYMPGRAITTVIKKKKAEKKLTFFISQTGKVTGNLITTYKNSSTLFAEEIQTQNFLVSGNYDSAKRSLLLVLTHIKSGTKESEAYLTFRKPDSVYYNFSYKEEPNKIIITCIPDNTLNRSTEEFWAETTLLGGLSSYVSDKNAAHLLPMRIRFEEEHTNDPIQTQKTILASIPAPIEKNKKEPKPIPERKVKPIKETIDQALARNKKIVYTDSTSKKSTSVIVSNSDKVAVPEKELKRRTIVRRTITLDTCCFKIELYDNGEIDGDIATLLLDGKIIIDKHLLSTKAASLNIDLSDQSAHEHILELFANNMGLIPPNTALIVLTCNKKRFEITLSSTEEINEAVILKIRP